RALLGTGQTRALLRQMSALDGDAGLIGDRGEQPQLLAGEPPPRLSGDIHDPQRLVLEVEGNAGVVAQPRGHRRVLLLDGGTEAATFQHVDVLWRQLALAKLVGTPAPAPA